jgi:hypothetical protein
LQNVPAGIILLKSHMPWQEFIDKHHGSLTRILNVIADNAAKGNFDDLKEFLGYYKDGDVRKDIDANGEISPTARKWGSSSPGSTSGCRPICCRT